MSDTTNIRILDAYVTINFSDLERFNDRLSLDEIVFFQYLVFKCGSNAGEWWQSQKNIEAKLKIKRTRLDSIVKRFKEEGVLECENKGFRNNRHYSLNFAEVAKPDYLQSIYNWPGLTKAQQKAVTEVFKLLAKSQQAGKQQKGKSTEPPVATKSPVKASDIGIVERGLISGFHERRAYYNKNKTGRVLSDHPLVVLPKHRKQIEKALAYFNSPSGTEYIINAFTAYCDELNNIAGGTRSSNTILDEKPKTDLLGYFLSSKNGFAAITTFSAQHTGYGHDRA